jgi:hypothetical protein
MEPPQPGIELLAIDPGGLSTYRNSIFDQDGARKKLHLSHSPSDSPSFLEVSDVPNVPEHSQQIYQSKPVIRTLIA